MSRKPREGCESNLYNAGIKGHNSQLLFYDDDDRLHFLKALFHGCEEFEVGLAAWSLMSNHVHFLLHGDVKKFSSFFKSIGSSYSQWLAAKYSASGEVWEGRYFTKGIESETYYMQVASYIFNNPVYAGIVSEAQEYEWSNFNEICLKYDDEAIKLINSVSDVDEIIELTEQNAHEKLSKTLMDKLEVFPKIKVSDDDFLFILEDILPKDQLPQISLLSEEQQREIVNALFDNGANITQISRITGISRRWVSVFAEG